MVWGGEEHGLYFEDFTDEWKGPAHEQWPHQGPTYMVVQIDQEATEEETGKEEGEGTTAEEVISLLSVKG